MSDWEKAQKWESSWHGNCVNSLGEELKQILYAQKMGLKFFHDGKSPYNIDMNGKSVLDIGGGPTSILLRCKSVRGTVCDPLEVPNWVKLRYATAGILFKQVKAENLEEGGFDEVWIYNVLQHTENPELVIEHARHAAKLIRIFEWIDTPTNIGHIHTLTKENLDRWLQGNGKVEHINGEYTCTGRAYYGIFST